MYDNSDDEDGDGEGGGDTSRAIAAAAKRNETAAVIGGSAADDLSTGRLSSRLREEACSASSNRQFFLEMEHQRVALAALAVMCQQYFAAETIVAEGGMHKALGIILVTQVGDTVCPVVSTVCLFQLFACLN